MSGEFKLEVELKGTRYVLNRTASAMLLEQLEGFGDECGDPCKRLREDLRKALDGVEAVAPANPFDEAEVTEEHTFVFEVAKGAVKNVAKENEAECGDCRVPRCRFCDMPGKRAGGRKNLAGRTVERYYVCETEGCLAAKMKTPQPAKLFAGGDQ